MIELDKTQFKTIDKKLEAIIGLLTMSIMKDKTLQEQAQFLKSLGLTQGEIAGALGKTVNNIKQALHLAREKDKLKKGKTH